MELHIRSDFECVYGINGELTDRADSITMSEYDIVYVTVFPIDIRLLPYTVKIVNADNVNNPLAVGVRLSPEHYLLTLSPRLPVLYRSPDAFVKPLGSSRICRLFGHVKNGDMTAALAMLSDALKTSVDRSALEAFFAGYDRIAECTWANDNTFYLLGNSAAPRLCAYSLKDEFIDDITQLD